MSTQHALFHDSIYDALSADIAAIGGIKKVAAMLWPNKEDGASRLRACLSIEHSQKLDPEELLAIKRLARDADSAATVNYEAQQLGYRVEWVAPEDNHARLQREFIQSVARLEDIRKQLAQNETRLRPVK